MGYFDGVDVDDIPDNPNELPNNTYKFSVIQAKLAKTNPKEAGKSPKTGITFKYQIVEGSYSTFFPLVDWVRVPDANTAVDEIPRMLSFLKMRLLAFGFTIDEIREFGPGDELKSLNRNFYGTTAIKKQGDQTNIKVVKFDPIGDGTDTEVDFPVPDSGDDDIAY